MKFLKSYKAIYRLSISHIKNLFFDVKKIILLFSIVCFLLVSFYVYVSSAKKPVVALVTDDTSFQMNMIVKNLSDSNIKNTFSIEKRAIDDTSDAVFVIEIEDDAIKKMETNPPVNVFLKYSNSEPTSLLIKNYIGNIVTFVNSTQKSAMLYWNKMKEDGVDIDTRIQNLNGISLFIISNFMKRDEFVLSKAENKYLDKVILLILFITAMFINNDMHLDFKNGIYDRLRINGFKHYEYMLSRFIVSTLISIVLVIALVYLFDMSLIHTLLLMIVSTIMSILFYVSSNYLILFLGFISIVFFDVTLCIVLTIGLLCFDIFVRKRSIR